MNPKRHSTIAALLVAATLVAPGTALAAGPVDTPLPAVEAKGEQSLALPVFKITREEAVAIATKTFAIPAEMTELTINLSQSKEFASWELNWRTPSKQPNPRSITVIVNGLTGQIASYYTSTAQTGDAPLSYSRSQAYKIAQDWLAKLYASQADGLRYVDNPLDYGFWGGNANFQFHWDRLEKGYPVTGQGLDIAIDARTGDLQSYSVSWGNEVKAELPQTILEKAQAEAVYREQLPMQMLYRYFRKPATEKGEWKLIYRPFGSSYPSVSQEGKLVDYAGKPVDFASLSNLKLVPAAAKPYEKPAKALTPDEALAVARTISGRTETPTNYDCREYGDEKRQQACSFFWSSVDENDRTEINVQIDLAGGVVQSYGHWGPWAEMEKDTQPKFTTDQARTIAIEFVQKYRPDMAGKALITPNSDYELKMAMAGEPIRSYHFQFIVTHEYIPIVGQEFSAEVDAMTGEIRYFYAPTVDENANETFPEAKDLIKADTAIDSFLKNQGIELTWVTFNPAIYGPAKADPEAEPVTQLVWAPRRVFNIDMIDAVTGAPLDYSGRDLVEAAKRPTDIEGHFAQREIELLWARGIFDLKNGKFNPDQTVTSAELARWLVLARGMQPYIAYDFAMNFRGKGAAGGNLATSEAAPYFGAALQAGILLPEDFADDADPNAPVSRELYALWVVRALGYGDIAKMENRIEMPFTDKAQIGDKYANAAAMLYGLKISRGDAEGKFNPQRVVSRGEAAQMLFAVASKPRSGPIYPMY